jgi:molybdopterin converting factor small subunit
METSIQITCFAGLRKFFDPQVNIRLQLPASYQSLIHELKKMNPDAAEILDNCRIAVNEKFVPHAELKTTGEPVFLIPPSSGG